MTAISFPTFMGEIPRLDPRSLPRNYATEARNTRLENSNLQPFRKTELVNEPGVSPATIYLWNGTWLAFTVPTSVTEPPIDVDRLYFSDSVNGLRMRDTGGTVYDVSLPGPTTKPDTTLGAGTVDPDLQESITFVYTWVTAFDEESPPSPAADLLDWSPGIDVTVDNFEAAPAGRNIDRRRIYRSQTSESGVTDFYFVAEIVLATTSYVSDLAVDPLQEPITTTNYDAPPDDMQGLQAMANGILVGFSGKTVCFSEPYVPHAWPLGYRLTTQHTIVGLAAFGQTVAVMTTGNPVLMSGAHPENMVEDVIKESLPCLSGPGIVNFGYSAAYPSHRGLVLIGPNGAQIVSQPLFSEENWRALVPQDFFAANYEGQYVFAYVSQAGDTLDAGAHDTDYGALDTFDGGTQAAQPAEIATYDAGGAAGIGARELGIIDLTGEQPYFVRLAGEVSSNPTTLYLHESTGELYLANIDDEIREFDAETSPPGTYRWSTGDIWFGVPVQFSAIMVQSRDTAAGASLTTRVFADGTEIDSDTRFGVPNRLAGGRLANVWRIELEGTAEVTRVVLAQSMDELWQVAG